MYRTAEEDQLMYELVVVYNKMVKYLKKRDQFGVYELEDGMHRIQGIFIGMQSTRWNNARNVVSIIKQVNESLRKDLIKLRAQRRGHDNKRRVERRTDRIHKAQP
jgi:hypothetical protein